MIVGLTLALAEAIAADLRESDRVEVIAANGGREIDWQGWANRVSVIEGRSMVGLVEGRPVVMGGFFEVPSGTGDVCGVWMVATPEIATPAGSRVAARIVARGHRLARRRFTKAITWADTGNEDAMAMLMRLGYRSAHEPVLIGGRRFICLGKELK